MARAAIMACIVVLLASSAKAIDTVIRLDGLSAFFIPGGGQTAVPSGSTIPISLWKRREGTWALRAPASRMATRQVAAAGLSLNVRLEHDANGECVLDGPTFTCRLFTVFVVRETGREEFVRVPLQFTSEPTGKSIGHVEAALQGAPLNPDTGYLQLVAVGELPIESPISPGQPFYVVLSGQLEFVPNEMALQAAGELEE
jgi:hypothetical protein